MPRTPPKQRMIQPQVSAVPRLSTALGQGHDPAWPRVLEAHVRGVIAEVRRVSSAMPEARLWGLDLETELLVQKAKEVPRPGLVAQSSPSAQSRMPILWTEVAHGE